MVKHLDYTEIVSARIENGGGYRQGFNRPASGYGGKLVTPYMLTLSDGRERRVYAMQYGNGASVYVRRAGEDVFLDTVAEHALPILRHDGAPSWADALAAVGATFTVRTHDAYMPGQGPRATYSEMTFGTRAEALAHIERAREAGLFAQWSPDAI